MNIQSAIASRWSIIPCGVDKKPLFPWKAYQERNPTGPEIIAGLDGLDEDGTIQEIKGEKIYWMTDRGQERITSFKAFFNRLPKIRK